jgi:uncharacterized membrane protein
MNATVKTLMVLNGFLLLVGLFLASREGSSKFLGLFLVFVAGTMLLYLEGSIGKDSSD